MAGLVAFLGLLAGGSARTTFMVIAPLIGAVVGGVGYELINRAQGLDVDWQSVRRELARRGMM